MAFGTDESVLFIEVSLIQRCPYREVEGHLNRKCPDREVLLFNGTYVCLSAKTNP